MKQSRTSAPSVSPNYFPSLEINIELSSLHRKKTNIGKGNNYFEREAIRMALGPAYVVSPMKGTLSLTHRIFQIFGVHLSII